jgi:acetylornithine deacetylase
MTPDALLQETVTLLRSLIAIPSLSGKEGEAADFLQKQLQGFFPGKTVQRLGHNLIVDIAGSKPGPTLMLCSHFDTVPVATGWTRDPFGAALEGDRIYGLGANDAGASVVSMIAAARMMKPDFAGRLLLCLVAEEEAGNNGFVKIEPELPRYDAAIFGEPTNMGMAAAMRGTMRAIMRSHGVACHASRPWEGKNACDVFAHDLQKLRSIDLKDDSPWKGTTIEPTILQGGKSFNQIPDLIEATLDIRTTPKKNNEWVIERLKKTDLDIEITINRRHPICSDPSSPLIQAIRKADAKIPDYIFYGGCDMTFSTATSVVMGPGCSERSHAADEFIVIPELAHAITTYAAVLREYLA